jgi:hypothetical protein
MLRTVKVCALPLTISVTEFSGSSPRPLRPSVQILRSTAESGMLFVRQNGFRFNEEGGGIG